MYEYKTERVDPSEQEEIINSYVIFGWELMSAQETYNESNEVVGTSSVVKPYSGFKRNITTYVQTSKNIVNYVTIQFRRDRDLPKNKKLIELEHQAWDNFPQAPQKPYPALKPIKLTLICILAMLVITIIAMATNNIPFFVCVLVVDLVLLIIVIAKWVVYKKDNDSYYLFMSHYEEQCAAYKKEYDRRMKICEEAKRIYYEIN